MAETIWAFEKNGCCLIGMTEVNTVRRLEDRPAQKDPPSKSGSCPPESLAGHRPKPPSGGRGSRFQIKPRAG